MPPTPDPRLEAAKAWLGQFKQVDAAALAPASSDASFRRYFRAPCRADTPWGDQRSHHATVILMDAPPDKEPLEAFLKTAGLFEAAGVHVPQRLAVDQAQGFLLLSDLGQTPYLTALQSANPTLTGQDTNAAAAALYREAWQAMLRWQAWSLAQGPDTLGLARYSDEKLMAEMQLFEDWYVGRHMGSSLSADEKNQLSQLMQWLSQSALAQPQVLVHRDYHSRNLMLTPERNPGVIDFQDAVIGPISYDLVSLLRDAYIQWDEAQQLDWAIRYWQDARSAGLPIREDFADFWRDFELMGLQRHLKVLGIFARLFHRDGKENYLKDLPLVLQYTRSVASRYIGCVGLLRLLDRLENRAVKTGYTF
ncbi:MAG: aminoglycoside phosphotransferase family protein [Burkholderiaceae bacterium]